MPAQGSTKRISKLHVLQQIKWEKVPHAGEDEKEIVQEHAEAKLEEKMN